MATYLELKAQAQKLFEQAEGQRKKDVAGALESIVKAMSDFEIRLEELFDHLKASGFKAASKRQGAKPRAKTAGKRKGAAKVPSKVAARFQNPPTGETWSGRGRAPAWIRVAEENGKSRDKFLIK